MSGEYAEYQQRRGRDADIIDEAIAAYESWVLDDDYDALGCLERIMNRMRDRRDMTSTGPTQ